MSLDSKNTSKLGAAASKLAVSLTAIGALTMNSAGVAADDVSAKVSHSAPQPVATASVTNDSKARYLKYHGAFENVALRQKSNIIAYVMPEVDKKDENLIALARIARGLSEEFGIPVKALPLSVGNYPGEDDGMHAPGTIQIFEYDDRYHKVRHEPSVIGFESDEGGRPIDNWEDLENTLQIIFNERFNSQVNISKLKHYDDIVARSSLSRDNGLPDVDYSSGAPGASNIVSALD